MIYFYSDPHFYHENIIRLAGRPFDGIQQMDHRLVELYNDMVTDSDEVYFLGDLAFHRRRIRQGTLTPRDVNKVIKKLKGRKHLIAGNHDSWFLESPDFDRGLFLSIGQEERLEADGRTLILLHDPAPFLPDPETGEAPQRSLGPGEMLIYGHVHNNLPEEPPVPSCCVCVEVTSYSPVSLEAVLRGEAGWQSSS